MTLPNGLHVWVEVASRRGLDEIRRLGVAEAVVVRGDGAPIYGRPGDLVCVRLDVGGRADRAVVPARLPLRAGLIVPATSASLALLSEAAARGRAPLGAVARSVAEARAALVAGATVLVAPDVVTAGALAEAADGGGATVLVETRSALDLDEAVAARVDGVLVPDALVGRLLEGDAHEADAAFRRAGTIGAALERAAKGFGARPAFIHAAADERLTFRELRIEARRVGRGLMALGVLPGDRVAVLARNVPAWPVVQLAVAEIGAILVTVNPSLREEEVEFILAQSGSLVLLAGLHRDDQAAFVGGLMRPVNGRRIRASVLLPGSDPARVPGTLSWREFLSRGSRVTEAELDRVALRVLPEDAAMILYTSGTTGFPKGAVLTHGGVLQNAAAVGGNLHLSGQDRVCLPVPFHHCFGAVMGTLACLVHGSSLVIPSDAFDAEATLRAIAAERCTALYGVPTMFLALLEHPDRGRTDLSSLRTGIIAGAPVDPALGRRISDELHLPELVVAYGLTEASPVVTQTAPSDPDQTRLGTVGRPIVGAEVRAVDESGRAVPDGTPGELVTRGPMVMRGYHDLPRETAAAIDTDGWLHTGDLGVREPAGTWRIVGRVKEMVIRGGENVYPAEVEAALRGHPAITDAYVVGVPSERYGEEVFAWVRPRLGKEVSEAEVQAFLEPHLARFKIPRWVRVRDEIPMTASGKPLKGRLRESAIETLRAEGVALPSGGWAASPPVGVPAATAPGTAALAAEPPPIGLPVLGPKAGPLDLEPMPLPPASSWAGPSGSATAEVRGGGGSQGRPGWGAPARPGWRWEQAESHGDGTEPDAVPGEDVAGAEQEAVLEAARRRGRRLKTWGIGGDIRRQIEGTGEFPIMYRALGTPPQTEHPFNLYFDIRSQPQSLRETFEAADEIRELARRIVERDPTAVIGLGSGTSQFVAQVANAAFARFAGIPGWDYDSLAFLRHPPPHDFKQLLAVAYSGSGSTVDTVAGARACREEGALTVAFTSIEGSPVVQNSDARILTAGGFDTGGSDTFHYTARIAAAILLALEVGRLRRPGAHDYDALTHELLATAERMATMFDAIDARCRTVAEQYMGVRSILVVGAGPNYGTAEEIALKFDEMSHIPTKAMLPGRHIHGALGLTDEAVLTVLVAPPGPSYGDLRSIAEVTRILKTPSVAIVSEADTELADMCDYVVRIPMQDETIFTVLAVLPGQLLPYWCGVGLGLNPDTQRSNVPKHAKVWNMLFPPGTH